MANIVITSGTDYLKVDFGDYSATLNMKKGYWSRSAIQVTQGESGIVNVIACDGVTMPLASAPTDGAYTVDSVNGAVPSSNSDLCDKLGVLVK